MEVSVMKTLSAKSQVMTATKEAIELTTFSKDDFKPAERVNRETVLSRPSLSYWQDAWRRFKKNRQALLSLVIVGLLVGFSVIGPFLWTIDPNGQDLNRVAIAPSFGEKAIVLGDSAPWAGVVATKLPPQDAGRAPASAAAPQNFHVAEAPTTQSVRLTWNPVPEASGYAVYRNEFQPKDGSYGVPMGDIPSREQISFEDNASLEPGTYFYTLFSKSADGTESSEGSTIKVEIPTGMTLENAQAINPNAKPGELISLRAAPFGTDSLGRDLLARLMFGGRISLFIGIAAALLYVSLGVFIGGIAGYFGGKVDARIMQFTDFITGLPFLLFMILLKVVLAVGPGESGIAAMMIALVVLSWTGEARLVRGQILQLRESEFVQAARMMGARPLYLIFRHLFPNLLGLLLVSLTFGIPSAIFTEVFLSFIGLGVASPAASWGSMCTEAIQTIQNHPHEFFFPAIFISITVLAFNLLGDGLRDALDPKLRSNE